MRAVFAPLVLVACTADNPAFLVGGEPSGTTTAPAAGTSTGEHGTSSPHSTSGTTGMGASGTTTGTTTAEPASTGAPPDTTGLVDTTGPVVGSTGEPGTSTSTSTSGDSSGGDTSGSSTGIDPPVCELPLDLGPLAKVLDRDTNEHIKNAACMPWAGVAYVGKLKIDPMGFLVEQDMVCGGNKIPANLRITVPIPQTAKALNSCVTIKFAVHANYPECHLSWLQVDQGGSVALTGRFGTAEPSTLPGLTVEPGLLPGCECPDCCGPGVPDPGHYDLLVNGVAVPETMPLDGIPIAAKKYAFRNLRSHVHMQCKDPQYLQADWLHVDWVAARTF